MSARPFLLAAVCDISLNAACDCGFSRDESLAGPARYLDVEKFDAALVAAGISAGIITNSSTPTPTYYCTVIMVRRE